MTFQAPTPARYWFPPQWAIWLMTLATLVGLYAVQIAMWPTKSWVLLIATPVLAFVPAGLIVRFARRRLLPKWAAAHGFQYTDRPNWPMPSWNIKPFNVDRATRKKVVDAMTGRVGRYPATYVHCRWINNNKVAATTHQRNVFMLQLPARLPRLTIGLSLDDDAGEEVEFESVDFGKYYVVQAPNPRYAHAVMTPLVMQQLLDLTTFRTAVGATKYAIVDDHIVAISLAGSHPTQLSGIFAALAIIADGIPQFVWDDYGLPPQQS